LKKECLNTYEYSKNEVYTNYFIPSSLFAYMLKYNVDVRQLSPLESPSSVGEFPIVFNIDVATHKVWEAIKDKKPLIITGSNKEILSQKIVEWLLKSSADDKS